MRKPLIGIVPLVDSEKDSFWMLPGYMEGTALAGGLPVMLPLTDDAEDLAQLAETCDGFLFSGGHDVSPAVYREEVTERCGETCPARDGMETALLRLALERDMPVLGICRGIQLINAILGGTLYQDLPTERPSDICHRQKPPYDRPVHQVSLVPDTPLRKLLDREKLPVNSCHHQAVKALSPELRPMAYSEDGLVEAVWLPGRRYVWAVQWHPEFCYRNDESRRIFESFISACRPENG